jgi:hypothetical protein
MNKKLRQAPGWSVARRKRPSKGWDTNTSGRENFEKRHQFAEPTFLFTNFSGTTNWEGFVAVDGYVEDQ